MCPKQKQMKLMAADKNNLRKERSSNVHHQSSDLCYDNHDRVYKQKGLPLPCQVHDLAGNSRKLIPIGSARARQFTLESSGEDITLWLVAGSASPLGLMQEEQGRVGHGAGWWGQRG